MMKYEDVYAKDMLSQHHSLDNNDDKGNQIQLPFLLLLVLSQNDSILYKPKNKYIHNFIPMDRMLCISRLVTCFILNKLT